MYYVVRNKLYDDRCRGILHNRVQLCVETNYAHSCITGYTHYVVINVNAFFENDVFAAC